MAVYEPGGDYPLSRFTQVDFLGYPKAKRALSSGEYEYYHSFLEDEKTPEPIKAGVAVVLLADLKRWFGQFAFTSPKVIEDMQSPQVMEYVEKFMSYPQGSAEKNQASFEIKKFDQYLVDSVTPGHGVVLSAIQESRKGMAVRLAIAKREAEKQMSVEELLAEERKEAEAKQQAEEARLQALVVADALKDHMIAKFREYLAGVFDSHSAKFFIDDKNAQREFKFRMDLIKKVTSKKLDPMVAIAQYQKVLDDFTGLKKDIPMTIYGHPIQSELRSGGTDAN